MMHITIPSLSSDVPAAGPHRRRLQPTWSQQCWTGYVLVIYAYLFLCMFFGGPYFAFDHDNYINFLNDPEPFFFEPLFTIAAFGVNWVLSEESRFPAIFTLFTLPPLLIVWRANRRMTGHAHGMMIFACVLTKSFYIGYISQRFFFAELWVCAAVIHAYPQPARKTHLLITGMLHFSILTVLASMAWLRTRFTWRKLSLAATVLGMAYFHLNFLSTYQFFGYDYTRYIDLYEPVGFPLLSLLQMGVLALICRLSLPRHDRANLIALVGLTFLFKLLFAEIEVFSRIFQIQTDLIIIVAALKCRRAPLLLYVFCFGFLLIQMVGVSTSPEMALFHFTAIQNALTKF